MKVYKKLVRDKIPEIIESKGSKPFYYSIDDNDGLKHLLKMKLIEEAGELFCANSLEKIVEELADVYEVLDAILEFSGITVDEVEYIRRIKNGEKGKFDKGYFLVSVDDD